jgi:hypothetical protein
MTPKLREQYLQCAADLERWMYEIECSVRVLRQIAGNSKTFGSVRTIAMSNGTVTLIHAGNLFDLNKDDRQFMSDLLAIADQYEAARQSPVLQSPGPLQESTEGPQGGQGVGLASTDSSESPDLKEEGKGGN